MEASGRRDVSLEEEQAFWAWAIIEVLRATGIRIEELRELSHHSLVQYRLPSTGELVPLLQIAPSKTDAERLLTPTVELRTAQIVEAGDDGVDMYTYESSVYDRDARFWIDRSTRHMLRYRFRQGSDQWEIAAAD